MTSNFPTSLDSFANPQSSTLLSQPNLDHSDQHSNINDAIEALQARVGIEGTLDQLSLEYRLTSVEEVSGATPIVQNTADVWTGANPILAANQIGIESDTLKMKVGNGLNWNNILYATVTPSSVTNSLEDYILVSDRGNPGGVASLNLDGLIPDSEIPSTIARDSELTTHISDTINIHGISDTSVLATQSDISTHNLDTTSVHGIADTSQLLTTSGGTVSNLTVTGNLTVQGTTTTVDTANLEVTDSLIYLASEQFDTDVLDIGVFGAYGDIQSGHLHTGLVRDASDGKWKLISNATEPTSSELDFSGVTYDTLKVGGIEVGNVSNTEIGYLDGVTSSIQSQLDAKAGSVTQFNQQSSSYTLVLSDKDKVVEMSGGGTVTIPAESSVNYPNGSSIEILQTGSSQVTIAGDTGVTVNGTPGLKLRAQWSSVVLLKRSSDLWVLSGDLSS